MRDKSDEKASNLYPFTLFYLKTFGNTKVCVNLQVIEKTILEEVRFGYRGLKRTPSCPKTHPPPFVIGVEP